MSAEADYDKVLDLVEGIAKPFETLHRLDKDGFIHPYHDCSGYPTIGWGHLLSREKWAPLDRWEAITRRLADELYREDVLKALKGATRLLRAPVSPEQLAALTDFVFNAGAGNLQISTLLKMVNRGDYRDAADEFPKWNKSAGVALRGLTRRRLVERDLFLSGTT